MKRLLGSVICMNGKLLIRSLARSKIDLKFSDYLISYILTRKWVRMRAIQRHNQVVEVVWCQITVLFMLI